jgi:hypothetical protein
MRTAFALALTLVCSSFVAAQAQDPAAPARPGAQQPSPSPAQPSTPSSSASKESKVTYTGCLKPGSSADSWVLENAEASAAGASKSATAGTSGASKMTLGLMVKPSENIKPHANHKIEVTGTVSSASPSASPSGAQGATASPRQTLNVESVKMVAATCP